MPENERKEVNVLFNDARNTFYVWLYALKKMQTVSMYDEAYQCQNRFNVHIQSKLL